MNWLIRTGGILLSPRATFRLLLSGRAGGLGDVLILFLVVLVGTAPVAIARTVLGTEAGFGVVLARIFSMYLRFCVTPLLACLATALVVVGALRFRGRRVSIEAVVAAAAYLWVPVAVLGLLGAMLSALGVDLWILPHVPLFLFLRSHPPWWMIVLRLPVAYGWSLYLTRLLFEVAGREPDQEPSVLPATGAWILGGWIGLSFVIGGGFLAVHYERIRPMRAGDEAANVSLERLDGQGDLSVRSFPGRTLVLYFWGTWCPKCVGHMPELSAWAKRHPNVAVLAIHQGKDVDSIRRFVSKRDWEGIHFLVDTTGEASLAYRVDSLPAYIVVRPDGRIAALHVGTPPEGWLDKHARAGPRTRNR